MKLSDFIVSFIEEKGTLIIFGLTGGSVVHLFDSIGRSNLLDYVCVRNEPAAAFAAEGFQRVTGKVGVVVATSGPGSTNLTSGIATAWTNSIPCLYICGQVDSFECNWDGRARQKGHQEINFEAIVQPITKYAHTIKHPGEMPFELSKAWAMANEGRPGPVVLVVPCDFFRQDINLKHCPEFRTRPFRAESDDDWKVNSYLHSLLKAQRPAIVVGGGIRKSGAILSFRRLIQRLGIPVAATQGGIDALQHNLDEYVGFIGIYGNRSANFTVANSDLLLVLGSRLESRVTGLKPETFARHANKIIVDVDANQFNLRVRSDLSINMDVMDFLSKLETLIDEVPYTVPDKWAKYFKKVKYDHFSEESWGDHTTGINPYKLIAAISAQSRPDDIFVVDCGQTIMRVLQSFHLKDNQLMITDTGMVGMGYGLPTGMGAAFAVNGSKRVIVLTGDGSCQMNIQELETIHHNKIPLKIIIFNNHGYGLIKQMQDGILKGCHHASGIGYSAPNFINIAQAFGIPSLKVTSNAELQPSLKMAFESDQPYLMDVHLPANFHVYPKGISDRPIEEQHPPLPSEVFNELMIVPPFQAR